MAVLVPVPAAGAVLTWCLLLALTRYVSVASMSAGLMIYLLHTSLAGRAFTGSGLALTCFCGIAAALVVVRHQGNLRRLLKGAEGHLKESATMEKLARIVHVVTLAFWFGGAAFFTFVATPLIFESYEGLVENRTSTRPDWMPSTSERRASSPASLSRPCFPWYFLPRASAAPWLATFRMQTAGRRRSRRGAKASSLRVWSQFWLPSHLQNDTLHARAWREAARAAFASWHLLSLLLNFITVGLAGVAMGMAAFLPAWPRVSAGRNV